MAGESLYSITVTTDPAAVDAMVSHLERALTSESLQAMLAEQVQPYMSDRIRTRFRSQSDPSGGKWKPLAPFTQKDRAEKGYPPKRPILHRSGALERWLTGPGFVRSDTPTGGSLQIPGPADSETLHRKLTTAQFGNYHNTLGKRAAPVPARRVLGLTEYDAGRINNIVRRSLEEQIQSFTPSVRTSGRRVL